MHVLTSSCDEYITCDSLRFCNKKNLNYSGNYVLAITLTQKLREFEEIGENLAKLMEI